jgi:hypothetical protein
MGLTAGFIKLPTEPGFYFSNKIRLTIIPYASLYLINVICFGYKLYFGIDNGWKGLK